jgi:hypothetical protein
VSIFFSQLAITRVARTPRNLLPQRPIGASSFPRDTTTVGSHGLSSIHPSAWPGRLDQIVDSLNRIVVLIVNCAYLDMADNSIHSMVRLNVTNFAVVPLDDVAYTVMKELYPDHTVPLMPGLQKLNAISDRPATYNSDAFRELTASRPRIISAFLKQNYTIFYSDIDTVWMSSRLLDTLEAATSLSRATTSKALEPSEEAELVLTIDSAYADSSDIFCSCYIYAKPTINNLNMLDIWSKDISTGKYKNDQHAFQNVLNHTKHAHKTRVLAGDDTTIPNGWFYFRQFNTTQQQSVQIIHNNFIMGHERKKQRFQEHDLWHPSGRLEKVSYSCSAG